MPVALALAGCAARKVRSWRRAGALRALARCGRSEHPANDAQRLKPARAANALCTVAALNFAQCTVTASKRRAPARTRGPSHAGTAQAQSLRIRPSVSSVRPARPGGLPALGSMQGRCRCHRSPVTYSARIRPWLAAPPLLVTFLSWPLHLALSSLPLSLRSLRQQVPLLHLLPAPPVGPAYPPPNLRLCERASPVAPPREEELASRRINHQLVCP